MLLVSELSKKQCYCLNAFVLISFHQRFKAFRNYFIAKLHVHEQIQLTECQYVTITRDVLADLQHEPIAGG